MPTAGTGPFWSVIVPKADSNRVTNPSFEYGTAGWTGQTGVLLGTTSGTSTFGAWSVAVNGTTTAGTLRVGSGLQSGGIVLAAGSYNSSAYVWNPPGGRVALIAGSLGAGTYGTAYGSAVGWQRLNVGWGFSAISTVQLQVVADVTNMGTIYVDGVQIESGTIASTYIDGEQPGCSWDGLPHASRSSRSGDTRLGGSVVRLEDIGFTVDNSPGIGAPPFTTISQSYAQLDGGEFQRQRKAERRFQLTSLVSGTSWADLHYQRRRLIEALRIENAATQQPMRLLYSGPGGTLGINAVWDGGVQFDADGQSFSEGIVASFTAYDPDWSDQLQQGTSLKYAETVYFGPLLYRSPMGKWGSTLDYSKVEKIYALAESLDGGTIYAGVNFVSLPNLASSRGLIYYDKNGNYGTVGNGTVSGTIFDLQWNWERTQLIIAGDLGTIGGTTVGQLGFWSPTTNTFGSYQIAGTGTQFNVSYPQPAVIRSILPWSYGTYYLGGHFHRINGTLLGSNWNILQWSGGTDWQAALPISVTGTGFVQNSALYSAGSTPGVVRVLKRFDQTRIFVGAAANTLRGYAAGINTALWDVRGTWGTVPGFTSPTTAAASSNDAYLAPDRSLYFVGSGTSRFSSEAYRIQGLTINAVGTMSGDINAIEEDLDTLAWIGGDQIRLFDGIESAVARTNGYDILPADIYMPTFDYGGMVGPRAFVCNTVLPTDSGTTWFGFTGTLSGALSPFLPAGHLGTIVNSGMANAYPTLRLRNQSTGTMVIRQWANMTTKEYVWFSLNMIPGEEVTLQTGPGRISFRSSYRGDILNTVMAGSKLSSWHLQPGINIVSFLAEATDIAVDMYWTPRHHSADGTGIA